MLQIQNFQEMTDADYEAYAGCDCTKHNYMAEVVVSKDSDDGIHLPVRDQIGMFQLLVIENEDGRTELQAYYYSDNESDEDWGILIKENVFSAIQKFEDKMLLKDLQNVLGNLSTEKLF